MNTGLERPHELDDERATMCAWRLFHVSENGNIARFEPRPPPSLDAGVHDPVVWAIGERLLHNYLVPRDCPRVTFYAGACTQPGDVERLMTGAGARHIVAVEAAWLERIRSTRLWLYEFPSDPFTCVDRGAEYHVARATVEPIAVTEVSDILRVLLDRDVELRVVRNLWGLRDAVVASTLCFSMIRMRNALPRPDTPRAPRPFPDPAPVPPTTPIPPIPAEAAAKLLS